MDPSFKNNLLNTLYFDLSDHFFANILKTRAWRSSVEKLSKQLIDIKT